MKGVLLEMNGNLRRSVAIFCTFAMVASTGFNQIKVSAKEVDEVESGSCLEMGDDLYDRDENYRDVREMEMEIDLSECQDQSQAMDNPYFTKEIMVFAEQLSDDFGASEVGRGQHMYLLRYEYRFQAMEAYKKLVEIYGQDKVMLNEVVHAQIEEGQIIESQMKEIQAEENQAVQQIADYYYCDEFSGLGNLRNSINSYSGSKNNLVIGVIDSGVNVSVSSELTGRVNTDKCASFITDSSNTTDTEYMDTLGHGTAVSYIIASCTPSNVSINVYKVFDGSGYSTMEGLYSAIATAYNDGVDVINMSLGMEYDQTISQFEEYFQAFDSQGGVICVSSGNYGDDGISADAIYPGHSDNVFCISATNGTRTNNKYDMASFACVGSSVDFSAIGESVVAPYIYEGSWNWMLLDGTSFSCPLVSAEFATIMTFYRGSSMEDYINAAKNFISTDFDSDYAANENYKSTDYGYGYMDFNNVTLCTKGEDNCHVLWHDPVVEDPTPNGDIAFEGYQMNTSYISKSGSVGGVRLIASVGTKIDDKYVESYGVVYGLANANGQDTGVKDSDMVVGSGNSYVFSHESGSSSTVSIDGISDDYTRAYVQTLTFGKSYYSAYVAKYKIRAYAKLSDGSYTYSDIYNYSAYSVSDYLYKNNMMPNLTAHNFLYDNILKVVNKDYEPVDYGWTRVLTK